MTMQDKNLYGDRATITPEEKRVVQIMIEKLWGGDLQALIYLRYIFHTFVRYEQIFAWMFQNEIKGKKIIDYFQNEAALPDGRGMIEPVRKILARIDQEKGKRLNKKELKNLRKFKDA